jgi:hypothetical protein
VGESLQRVGLEGSAVRFEKFIKPADDGEPRR